MRGGVPARDRTEEELGRRRLARWAWLAGLAEVCTSASAFRPEAIVVSLGVDAAADDPESPLHVTRDGYRRSGALIAGLGAPIVAVHEGGYHLATLGDLTVATLVGLSGRAG